MTKKGCGRGMARNERNELYIEMRDKELTFKKLSQMMGCSLSLLSKYFSHKCDISNEKEEMLIRIIKETKRYEWRKVEVN